MPGEPVEGAGAAPAERLIAQRLREAVAASEDGPLQRLLTRHDLERWLAGDAGHLQRAADLRATPIASHRGALGRPVVAAKLTLRRLLHPLLDEQSDLNAASARVIAFLLEQLAVQAEAIDELAREVAQLRSTDRLP